MEGTNETYNDALDGHWNSVRERRERLEKELLDLLPDFDGLKELFEFLNTQGSFTGTGTGVFRHVFVPTPIGGPVPVQVETYDFSGSISVERDGYSEVASVTGSLDLHINLNGLQSNGKIAAGSFVASFANGQSATLTVIKNAGNIFSTDSSGVGDMSFVVDFDHSLPQWEAILFGTYWLRADLTIDSSGQMTLSSPTPAPHSPMEHSDYNNDGILEYNSDFAAFLMGYAAFEDRADINADGVWNQDDIDLWVGDFTYDEEQSL